MTREAIGLYLHIPFCRGGKCPYCDFYSLPMEEELADAYTDALCRAMEKHPFGEQRADTLYLGGGTPSLLGARRLDRILETAARIFGLDADSEITLEANPGTVSQELLESLWKSGFNRVSFGVQSGIDRELEALGRSHNAAQAEEAILSAAQAGFQHISADLMLAIPGQTLESLGQSIAFLTGLPVDHISAYLLKVEEGTPFFHRREALSLPGEDAQADYYQACVEGLETAGFPRYEISNFARPGGKSCHNLKYWQCLPYLGIGPAAHSFLEGKRFFFPSDLASFLSAENPFSLLEEEGEGGGPEERVMLGLRLEEGFDAEKLRPWGIDIQPMVQKAAELAKHDLCRIKGSSIRLTSRGFLLSNSVISALLETIEG